MPKYVRRIVTLSALTIAGRCALLIATRKIAVVMPAQLAYNAR